MSVQLDQNINDIPITTDPQLNSNFTFNDLLYLNDPKTSYLSPLAVIALIDMNAFFAQVEQIRLNLTSEDPVVCVQWSSLIAVSYAARKFGIGRMDSVKTAKNKCPNVILAHAAVFKKGESNWTYLNHIPSQGNHKVSLDPYRRESRKIIRLFNQYCDLVEKASVDECYLDFGRLVYVRLINLFPFLENTSKIDKLPSIPSILPETLQWKGEIIHRENEESPIIKDWDDICMLIGSQILYELRVKVYKELGYTTSGGLARNKILAKIAGGFKKPDNQTIIRNSQIDPFLLNFSLTDFTGMGGKIGESILNKFDIPQDSNSISFIRNNYSLNEIEKKLNDYTLATKLYDIVRGNVKQELINRIDVKSMMSAKNFTITFDKLKDAYDWIKVFVGDLYNRLIELDDENLNLSLLQKISDPLIIRPKTLSLTLVTLTNVKYSKQVQIPITKLLENLKEIMLASACKVFNDIFDDNTNLEAKHNGRKIRSLKEDELMGHTIIPLRFMSMTISNFVRQKDSNLIDTYLNKGNEHISFVNRTKGSSSHGANSRIPDEDYMKSLFLNFEKESLLQNNYKAFSKDVDKDLIERKKRENMEKNKDYISKLFKKYNDEYNSQQKSDKKPGITNIDISVSKKPINMTKSRKKVSLLDKLISSKFCCECNVPVEDALEHNDHHVALKLSQSLNGTNNTEICKNSNENNISNKKQKTQKRQQTLPF